jgi:hypothetical protein
MPALGGRNVFYWGEPAGGEDVVKLASLAFLFKRARDSGEASSETAGRHGQGGQGQSVFFFSLRLRRGKVRAEDRRSWGWVRVDCLRVWVRSRRAGAGPVKVVNVRRY